MKTKDTTYIYLAFIAILCYNGFLIRRDHELLKAHDSSVIQFCQQQAHWHPDCNKK